MSIQYVRFSLFSFLHRVASSVQQPSVLLEYVCFPSINITRSLSDLFASSHSDSFQNLFIFNVFWFLFSGLPCVVVFSYPVRRHFTCFTHEFAIIFPFLVFLCLSKNCFSQVSLKDKESGRTLGVLMKLGRKDDLMWGQHVYYIQEMCVRRQKK